MTNKCTEIKVFKDPIKYVGVYSPDGFLPLRHKGKKIHKSNLYATKSFHTSTVLHSG